MNILHVLSQKELTGAEVYASTLIDSQQAHKVFQISNGFFKKNSGQQIPLKVETSSFLEFWTSVFKLRSFLITHKIQIIHAHSRAASKLVFYARMGLKIGYVSTVHGRQHPSFSKKMFNQYGDFTIPVCENIAHQLKNEFGYKPHRIKTVLNPIDELKFKPSLRSAIKLDRPLKIAIIGRTSGPKKLRTELFIKYFSQILYQKNISYAFHIIGGEIETSVAHEKHFALNMNSEFLQTFDLICGSGRVCMESLLSAVPCIAFGEAQYIGLITEKNFETALASNFGDVGENFDSPTFNATKAFKDVELWLGTSVNYIQLSERARFYFSLPRIQRKVMRLYESAFSLRNYPYWIPILMYHKIPDEDIQSKHKIFVNKDNFEKHLQFFRRFNFTTLTFDDLLKFRKGEKDWSLFPKNPLILTFDDGYEDNLKNADVLLKKYDMIAQIYLLAQSNLSSNVWDNEKDTSEKHQIVSAEDRHLWKSSNFVIGSHGTSHQRMPLMTTDEKIFELTSSKQKLEIEFGRPVISYAYTYGDTDAECARLAEECGYEYALNTDSGGRLIEEDPYSIFRVNIFPNESFSSLWKKTRRWYRDYYFFKRKK